MFSSSLPNDRRDTGDASVKLTGSQSSDKHEVNRLQVDFPGYKEMAKLGDFLS